MATLKEHTKQAVGRKRQALREAQEALRLVELLPEELQALDGEADTGYTGALMKIDFYQFQNKDIDLLRTLKILGVQGLTTKMSSPDNWYADGEIALLNEKDIVRICIYGLPKPPNCQIEEYQELVTKFRAICKQTGEEIGG